MIDHDRALELAAAALDFPLSDDDRAALQAHLDGCDVPGDRSRSFGPTLGGSPTWPTETPRMHLRARILAAIVGRIGPSRASDGEPRRPRPDLASCRSSRPDTGVPVALLATAAVVVALIGGTLFWRSGPNGGPDVAVATPSPSGADRVRAADALGSAGAAPMTARRGSPSPT